MIFSRFRSSREKVRLPKGVRIYAVGDVHGRLDLLEQLTQRIDAHCEAHPVAHPIEVYLGDYIDRGPSSRGVIDHLIGRRRLRKMVHLKGNHETFLLRFIKDPGLLAVWSKIGGLETLKSYLGEPLTSLTSNREIAAAFHTALTKHRAFLGGLKLSFQIGEYFFAHAGVRPGVALRTQSESDLLWIREDFLRHEGSFGKIIVHGHSPVLEPEVLSNRINVDTRAYASGRLTCAVLENNNVELIQVSQIPRLAKGIG